MTFTNVRHLGRLVIVPRLLPSFEADEQTAPPYCEHAVNAPLNVLASEYEEVFNFPFLFHRSGAPWLEANSYLLYLFNKFRYSPRPTDELRRRASKLLDYLIFCEDEGLDWLDLSGRRPVLRPPYKYFSALIHSGERSPAVINQYTGVVYDFYKFVGKNWHIIDLNRVDTTRDVKFSVNGSYGSTLISTQKRSQTLPRPSPSSIPIGFVRDGGEDLRPLTNSELAELLKILNGDKWASTERLIFLTALMTGARKQTVLTIRLKHIKMLTEENLQADGSYLLHAGPGTGIDTKGNKPQRLHVPKQVGDELKTLANSELMKRRQRKLKSHWNQEFPHLDISDDEMYLFLSEQGGCYYMAKDDPFYQKTKSRPTGQVTETLKRKVLAKASDKFPTGFSFHWLRATYAFQLYQLLTPLLHVGLIKSGEEISFIQRRLHHSNRETTENYLKLFTMLPERLAAQEGYEQGLFNFSGYDNLVLGELNG